MTPHQQYNIKRKTFIGTWNFGRRKVVLKIAGATLCSNKPLCSLKRFDNDQWGWGGGSFRGMIWKDIYNQLVRLRELLKNCKRASNFFQNTKNSPTDSADIVITIIDSVDGLYT